ncbi:MAG: HdeA/HdeB family chaperone [Thiothrix sp.]|jgi:hypothetical protein|uniref:HdeA/HdeB family chaperone n=1 Tax=Thiothrix sp. TaxID=1032 RepID=UPI0026092563|nr:HdeA/HdeB family chaperone [Thiothrix sp.]MDD5392229.1 HdeA/HdeB family chaperone [Thiothrix sp.]
MKKLLLALLLSCAPFAAANAWEFDMSTVTCKDMAEDEELGTMMIFWLDGYISAEQKNTNISEKWMDTLGKGLGDACAKDPDMKLLDIVKKSDENHG